MRSSQRLTLVDVRGKDLNVRFLAVAAVSEETRANASRATSFGTSRDVESYEFILCIRGESEILQYTHDLH